MWLLEKETEKAIERAYSAGILPSAEQQVEYEARVFGDSGGGTPRIYSVDGDVATIVVDGVLTNKPDFMSMIFGGGNTTYREIIESLALAEADECVNSVTMAINSPGGQFDGLFDALAAIQGTRKNITARVGNVAASAAFAIASQADHIVASGIASRVGSVGVMATYASDPNTVAITSTNAPKKAPDVTTEEGQGVVREGLDAMHEIFVQAIADGRGTDIDGVNANYGQGATLLANEAMKRGMIDAISERGSVGNSHLTDKRDTAALGGEVTTEEKQMDLTKLKAEHPDVYTAAVQEGATQERERVEAHMVMGEASGDMETACAAIKDGSEMTTLLNAKYMAAGMKKKAIEARDEDEVATDTAVATDLSAESQEVVATVCAGLGVKVGE